MNKTGSQIERENTHAKRRVIAAMDDLVIATIETRIIAKRIPVFMENRFARLNGSYHILKNTDAKNHAVYASRGIQMKRNIFITDIDNCLHKEFFVLIPILTTLDSIQSSTQ